MVGEGVGELVGHFAEDETAEAFGAEESDVDVEFGHVFGASDDGDGDVLLAVVVVDDLELFGVGTFLFDLEGEVVCGPSHGGDDFLPVGVDIGVGFSGAEEFLCGVDGGADDIAGDAGGGAAEERCGADEGETQQNNAIRRNAI